MGPLYDFSPRMQLLQQETNERRLVALTERSPFAAISEGLRRARRLTASLVADKNVAANGSFIRLHGTET